MATAIIQIPVEPKVAQAYAVSAPQIQLSIQQLGQQMISSLVFQSPSGEDNRALYAQDFFKWTQTTATLIRAGNQWYNIDRETLAEEVESLGISQKHALGSHLKNLVMHLLKWHYQPSGRQTGQSWRSSIYNARDEIAVILEDSPSLRREVPGLLARRYPAARMLAHDETGLSLTIFPETCPWTPEQVLDADFWPEAIP
jgi:Domain of unknown function DUF29